MTWHHPDLGEINPLLEHQRVKKTWRHFYSPKESWDQLGEVRTQRLYSAARTCGCPEWRAIGPYPDFPRSCRQTLREHHDDAWRDAYERELAAEEAWVGPSDEDDGAWLVASPRGVYAVLVRDRDDEAGRYAPKTVFRPHPLGLDVTFTEETYVRSARRRFWNEVQQSMRSNPNDLDMSPTTAEEVWALARALGEAGASGPAKPTEAIAAAANRLAALSDTLRASATPTPETVLDHLQDALMGDNDDVAGVLLSVEDAIAVTEVLAGDAEASSLLAQAASLLDWTPETWSSTRTLITRRLRNTVGACRAWWSMVDHAVDTALLHAAEPLLLESPSLTSKALPEAWWAPWANRVHALSSEVAVWLAPAPRGWLAGAATLSGDSSGSWELAAPSNLAPGARVFIVDEDNPDGEEVTEDLGHGPFWEIERPGERAVIVVAHGLDGETLQNVLDAAVSTSEGRIQLFEISRPM